MPLPTVPSPDPRRRPAPPELSAAPQSDPLLVLGNEVRSPSPTEETSLTWSIQWDQDPSHARMVFADDTLTLLQLVLTPDTVEEMQSALTDLRQVQHGSVRPDTAAAGLEPGWGRIAARFSPSAWMRWLSAPQNRAQRVVFVSATVTFVTLAALGVLTR